jgi:DNA modification methylase
VSLKPYYQHAGITIYHGDCREILPQLPELVIPQEYPTESCTVGACCNCEENDCPCPCHEYENVVVVCDPPYGISHSTHSGDYSIKGSPSWMNQEIQGDGSTELRDYLLDQLQDHPIAMFGSPKIIRPAKARMVLIWDKGAMCGMGDVDFPWKPSFEEIYIFGQGWAGRRDEGVIKGHYTISWESAGRTHQHEKPVSLLKHIIGKHPAECIVDPCCGTGATLVAAKSLGKSGIGIEIEEKYCEIAAKRLSQEVFNFSENRAGGVAT